MILVFWGLSSFSEKSRDPAPFPVKELGEEEQPSKPGPLRLGQHVKQIFKSPPPEELDSDGFCCLRFDGYVTLKKGAPLQLGIGCFAGPSWPQFI